MKLLRRLQALLFGVAVAQSGPLFDPKYDVQLQWNGNGTVSVDLTSLLNSRAFGQKPGEANFDRRGTEFAPPARFNYAGINFAFPRYGQDDNVLSKGQNVSIAKGRYAGIHILAASDSKMASGDLLANYADGSSSSSSVLVPAWWNWPYPAGGDIIFPHYLTNTTVNYNRSNIFQSSYWIDPTKDLTSLTLPRASKDRLHIFSISLKPAEASSGPVLEITSARWTRKWIEGSSRASVAEVTVANSGSATLLKNHSVSVSVRAPGYVAAAETKIKRLVPGDRTTVQVELQRIPDAVSGPIAVATVQGVGIKTAGEFKFNVSQHHGQFKEDYHSVDDHESPNWFDDAKFGIFIHWGVYAVPGWGNVGKNEAYAEWYWWNMQEPHTKDQTKQYHLETYGKDVVYDDFIANFSVRAFDPKEWVDLFADAGAKYFVITSKHHDGYALWDLPANVTKRTSVALYPHRDLLKELFEASKKYQPQMKRGTYLSLPEWFHPDYKSLGFDIWPGGNATNPWTNQTLPYTGYVPIKDYVSDLILPEMQSLATLGTDIMWCDIGGPNLTLQFASRWYNDAVSQGRQVTMNNRCGLPGDFDTPEYARFGAIQKRKWESNLGMDPYSYGYNRAIPDEQYMNASTIVTSLIDIISKNGNLLLDIGPRADGSIVEVEKRNLREAGTWIKDHAEAIYGTKYWGVTAHEGAGIRFTRTEDAFYIIAISKPEEKLVIKSPVPWVPGDSVVVVGGKAAGQAASIERAPDGSLVLHIPKTVVEAERYAWVFKIPY